MSDSDSTSGCPVDHGQVSECPVKHGNEVVDSSINDLAMGQTRQPGQTVDLSTRRAVSHIDRSNITPHHQVKGVDKWVYPSEQQYYNAMKRKGYNPDAQDVPVILAIHNTVNEQSWAMVREWESKYTSDPKLKKFMGRPKDLSPKAFLLSLFGYSKPFDRHDWVVDRNGEDVRYVIDFYRGAKRSVLTLKPGVQPSNNGAAEIGTKNGDSESKTGPRSIEPAMSIYLDVRPALDSYGALRDRVLRGVSTQLFAVSGFDFKAEARGAVTWLKGLFPLESSGSSSSNGKSNGNK